jgi:Flp pilus assembly protein TadB
VREVAVPLSREEQRALDAIERSLRTDDPRFAARIRDGRQRTRVAFGCAAAGFVCSMVLLITGLAGMDALHIGLAVTGFVVFVAACFAALVANTRRKRRGRWRRRAF